MHFKIKLTSVTNFSKPVALLTGVPGFLGTHQFSLTGKETHQLCVKIRKSTTGKPSIKNADKATANSNRKR